MSVLLIPDGSSQQLHICNRSECNGTTCYAGISCNVKARDEFTNIVSVCILNTNRSIPDGPSNTNTNTTDDNKETKFESVFQQAIRSANESAINYKPPSVSGHDKIEIIKYSLLFSILNRENATVCMLCLDDLLKSKRKVEDVRFNRQKICDLHMSKLLHCDCDHTVNRIQLTTQNGNSATVHVFESRH